MIGVFALSMGSCNMKRFSGGCAVHVGRVSHA